MRSSVILLLLAGIGCTQASTAWHSESVTPSDVQAITLVSWAYTLDGGTITLFAQTDDGEQCTITLNQHVDETYADPGRLVFNGKLIDVRSDDESKIIELLKTATLDPIDIAESDPENQIIDEALIIGDDIADVLTSPADRTLEEFRNKIIAFVKSDEYERIARDGL